MMTDVLVVRHVRHIRWVVIVCSATLPAGQIAAFVLDRRGPSLVSPGVVTVLLAAMSLWIGLTATSDASRRLDRAKRAYAAQGDLERLFRAHLGVYVVVLLRLETIAVGGLVTALWGLGPFVSIGFFALAGALMLLSWPTESKARLLWNRAEALRE